ncbi:formimidoylglutamate deiminase [Limobrevibacterium gyesilva]|uniref:Formimidoylglutamate deiminase n=1 Tax=Limobrevibacterium gyesilva TaxID=2991712 RepID=A0AA41YMF4_9PROT|nr:formimidoylglutamate deiminase [Limobrevibacterium gyesilva]MCW3476594.1 formimidoylglutamate deiminase [Limobrevibacterium gyesilva]
MSSIHAAQALTPAGWRPDTRLTIAAGRIAAVETGVPAAPGDERHAVAVPGMANLHSHAFQRGMAGLAEIRGPSADSFWSWRELMYRFALGITPDQLEAVAAQLYVEMLEAGFTRVGEFHYLHHDTDGRPYASIAEMAARIAAAAGEAGIGLTLLPVFYAHSGFGGAPANERQRRFANDLDAFARLLEGCRQAVRPLGSAIVGVAPHSLRAATPAELAAISALSPDAPIHIHVAEQVKEVEDCLAWSGARPVEWLLDHAAIDARWCLVHATHMTEAETRRLAASGAIAGLCPVTEANLGDGTFNALSFLREGGRFGIGSDSNVLIGVADELRQLEYSQRLLHRSRNVLAAAGCSSGRTLYDAALAGGGIALGAEAGLAPGAPADIVTLRAEHPAFVGRDGDGLLDAWIFATAAAPIDCVWAGGRKLVEHGRHVGRAPVEQRFRQAMEALTRS